MQLRKLRRTRAELELSESLVHLPIGRVDHQLENHSERTEREMERKSTFMRS